MSTQGCFVYNRVLRSRLKHRNESRFLLNLSVPASYLLTMRDPVRIFFLYMKTIELFTSRYNRLLDNLFNQLMEI